MAKHSIYGGTGIASGKTRSGIYGENRSTRIDREVDALVDAAQANQDGLAGIHAHITEHGDRIKDATTTDIIRENESKDDAGRSDKGE